MGLQLLLQTAQMGVVPLLGQQAGMVALLQNAALAEHQDLVGLHHGGEAVGNDDQGVLACLLYTSPSPRDS